MTTRRGSDGLPHQRPWWRDWVVGGVGGTVGGGLGALAVWVGHLLTT